MAARFGERNVFMDVTLQPGVDFVARLLGVMETLLADTQAPAAGAPPANPSSRPRARSALAAAAATRSSKP
jgi:hypothetical protein